LATLREGEGGRAGGRGKDGEGIGRERYEEKGGKEGGRDGEGWKKGEKERDRDRIMV